MRAFLLLLHVLGEAFTISSSFMLCPARPIRPTLVATPVYRPEACPTTPQHLLTFLGSVRLSLCFRLSASFDNDADGGNSESNEEDSHPIVAPSPETSTAPTQRLVGSEGMATISPFRSGSTYNSGAPALGVDPTRPPSYSPEESAFVEMKVDRMLVRKIDLWPPEEIFELMPLLMKVSENIEKIRDGGKEGERNGELSRRRDQDHSLTHRRLFLPTLLHTITHRAHTLNTPSSNA